MKKILKFLINLIPIASVRRSLRRDLLDDINPKNGLKIEKKSKIINVYKDNKCIRISTKHIIYLTDITKFFDFYFDSVEPVEQNGFKIVDFSYPHQHKVKGYPEHEIMFTSFVEPIATTQQYLDFAQLDENSIAIDLGAYSAMTSILFDKDISKNNSNAKGKTIAIDADGQNIICINHNLKNYKKISGRNIEYLHAVAASSNGVIEFSSEGNMGASTVDMVGKKRGGYVEKVPSITLNAIAQKYNLEKVDFIKCDIEGGEIDIFKDADFFEKYSPKIIIEAHYLESGQETSTSIVSEQLSKYGYTCKEVKQEGSECPLLECIRNQ